MVQNEEVAVPIRLTAETSSQAERILEALDLIYDEKKKREQYEKELQLSKTITEIMNDKVAIPAPEPSPLLMGKSLSEYLYWVISGIKASNLESALKILPFNNVLDLIGFLDTWITSRKEISLCSRILFYVLRHYQVQLSANKTMFETIMHIQKEIHAYIDQIHDLTEYNLAAMNLIKKQILQADPSDFFSTSDDLHLKKKRKQQKTGKSQVRRYWEEMSSDSKDEEMLEVAEDE